MTSPIPSKIKLRKASRTLELEYADGRQFSLPAEFLRVHSPSAEVQGHGRPVLQTGKQNVALTAVEMAGNYALKLVFDDGHDSGLYSWDYLLKLGEHQNALWQEYLEQLQAAGASRDPEVSVVKVML
ncbi:1-(5-phosphoribosyl)-5-[(5-phosphoribosylamino)methylideneamino] imidazole-4-carboxamide isomerase [Halopseudomonas bauzanensis]|nr:1-(5-phosphoribosyl)-5-[(5-phosphoribosylamino)methylideneamino] imidazole-4-carboxamide isomerase [Halopseudomonas bauzanensis]